MTPYHRTICVIKVMTLFLCSIFFSQNALAIHCTTSTGSTGDTVAITNPVSIPSTLPDGTVVWRGDNITINAKCYSNGNHSQADQVSMWVNPNNTAVESWNMEFGLNYNGVDYYESSGAIPIPGFVVPPCYDYNGGACNDTQNKTFTIQPLIRKQGFPPTPANTYDLFQLDGVNGLDKLSENYRLTLSGLSNIKGSNCSVTTDFSPSTVDLGSLPKSGNNLSASAKNFDLILTQINNTSCGSAFSISGVLTTTNTLSGNLLLPSSDSGFGLQITDEQGNEIPFNKVFALTSFTASSSDIKQTLTYKVIPTLISAPLKLGDFSAIATIQISYN